MPIDGEYEPSTAAWVRNQVEEYESSGGTRGTTLADSGLPVVIITNLGARSGKVRKTPLMRVEHDGRYAAVASRAALLSIPSGTTTSAPTRRSSSRTQAKGDFVAREVNGDERAEWWKRAVAAYPPYAEYQERTSRTIPVFVLEPADGG